MDIDGAARACIAAGHRLDDARAELRAIGDLGWTGPAAGVFADALEAEVRTLTRLRVAADVATRAVLKHAVAVRAAGGGCW